MLTGLGLTLIALFSFLLVLSLLVFFHEQRALVVLAGPVANFILAIVLFAGIGFAVGNQYYQSNIGSVLEGSPAESAGFLPGDKILALDGKEARDFSYVQQYVMLRKDTDITALIERDGRELTLVVTPKRKEIRDPIGGKSVVGQIGLGLDRDAGPIRESYGVGGAFGFGIERTASVLSSTGTYLSRIFTGKEDGKQLGSVVKIATVTGKVAADTASADVPLETKIKAWMLRMASLAASISIALGVANLMPLPAAAPAAAQDALPTVIKTIQVQGNQRIEANTVASYLLFAPGDPYSETRLDTSVKTLYATGLFADVSIDPRDGNVLVSVIENPIINRVILEGNKSLKSDKITDEISAEPRAIFTRSNVQEDVTRIIELYRQAGRFAATVEPKVVQQPQNRVDLIFEITEGPVTGVKRINIIGNSEFPDRRLRKEMATTESSWYKFFSSNDNYDPGRLQYDQEQLRTFYTNRGFADFRVVSAVAELTPDQEDFYITFTVDEGAEYRWGDVSVETELDTLNKDFLIPLFAGKWS